VSACLAEARDGDEVYLMPHTVSPKIHEKRALSSMLGPPEEVGLLRSPTQWRSQVNETGACCGGSGCSSESELSDMLWAGLWGAETLCECLLLCAPDRMILEQVAHTMASTSGPCSRLDLVTDRSCDPRVTRSCSNHHDGLGRPAPVDLMPQQRAVKESLADHGHCS
jgi:hypothetical protein